MDIILKYFTSLSSTQREQLGKLGTLYPEWNEKINVISRKDIDNVYEHHVLHSLAIAEYLRRRYGKDVWKGATVLDVGTGGGFPGIPLAMEFPETNFVLCDSIRKKITVAEAARTSVFRTACRVLRSFSSSRYHFREKPFGGKVTTAVGVKEAMMMITSGASKKHITSTAISLHRKFTFFSRIFTAPQSFHISGGDQYHQYLHQQNDAQQDITDG